MKDLCRGCGEIYDLGNEWSEHFTCIPYCYDRCVNCGEFSDKVVLSNDRFFEHLDLGACVQNLRRLLEEKAVERASDSFSLTELTEKVRRLTEGRRAAIREAKTLSALREAPTGDT